MISRDIAQAYRDQLLGEDSLLTQALNDSRHPLNEQARAAEDSLNWFAYLHPERDGQPVPLNELSGDAADMAKQAATVLSLDRDELDRRHGTALPWDDVLGEDERRQAEKMRQGYRERAHPTYAAAMRDKAHPEREAVLAHRDAWYDWMHGGVDGTGQPGPAPAWQAAAAAIKGMADGVAQDRNDVRINDIGPAPTRTTIASSNPAANLARAGITGGSKSIAPAMGGINPPFPGLLGTFDLDAYSGTLAKQARKAANNKVANDPNFHLARFPTSTARPMPQTGRAIPGIPDPNKIPTPNDKPDGRYDNIRPGPRDRENEPPRIFPSEIRPIILPTPPQGWPVEIDYTTPLDPSYVIFEIGKLKGLISTPLEMLNKWGGAGSPITQEGTNILAEACNEIVEKQYPDIKLIDLGEREFYLPPRDADGRQLIGPSGSSRADHRMWLQRPDGSKVMIFLNTNSTKANGDQTADQLRRYRKMQVNAYYFGEQVQTLTDWFAKLDLPKFTKDEYTEKARDKCKEILRKAFGPPQISEPPANEDETKDDKEQTVRKKKRKDPDNQ